MDDTEAELDACKEHQPISTDEAGVAAVDTTETEAAAPTCNATSADAADAREDAAAKAEAEVPEATQDFARFYKDADTHLAEEEADPVSQHDIGALE